MYIVLSGTHGIGKTTLARRVAEELDAVFLTESIDEAIPPPKLGTNGDPMLTQLWFVRQMILKEAQMTDPTKHYVGDRGWSDIAAYANVILDEHARNLFRSVYDHLPKRLPDVHLVVHAPIDVVLARIAARKRESSAEWNEYDTEYLARMMREFTQFYESYKDFRPIYLLDASGNIEENVKSALALIEPHMAEKRI